MPLPLMVRVDDDVAQRLRERAYVEHTPMNRIVNDALRHYFEALEGGKTAPAPIATTQDTLQTLRQYLKRAEEAAMSPANQSDAQRWKANSEFQNGILEGFKALVALHTASTMPITREPENTREEAHV